MLRTNLKIALRNLYRERAYAAINVAGLSLAIACALILILYLRLELTYDQHFDNHQNIYRVGVEYNTNGEVNAFAVTPPSIGKLLDMDFQEVEDYVVMRPALTPLFISHGSDSEFWADVINASDNFFDVFSHEIIYGDTEDILVDRQSVAISESFARRYFGNANPIGELLENEIGDPFVVDAVFADLPENTHLKYDLVLSYNRVPLSDDITRLQRQLFGIRDYNYVVMTDGFELVNFPSMSDSFVERNMAWRLENAENESARVILEPLADVHYGSDLTRDLPQGNRAYLYAFSVVALFILIVACINYTNLATARAIRRSKEVGLRKILGASKGTLMLQFLAEAMLYSLISTLIAIVVVEVALDSAVVTQMLGKSISFNLFEEPQLILWLALFTLGIGFLAGFYPAVYLSSWAPLSALVSSGRSAGKGNTVMRQALVLIQFTISISVIASTLLMANQMRFISDRELGFDKENIVSVQMIGADLIEKTELIRAELTRHPDILGVAVQQVLPGQNLGINIIGIENRDGAVEPTAVSHYAIDTDYLDVMGMELVAGRDFSQRLLTDIGTSVIVNETLVRSQGWEEPIGRRFANGRVIGVVKDFNVASLHSSIEPLALRPLQFDYSNLAATNRLLLRNYMSVRLAGNDTRGTLSYLRDRFSEYDPVHNVQFEFLDDRLNQLYVSETSLMRMVGIFAGVCIFIAALGLFGLASFTTEQRSKEIAIRKVLGASTGQIIMMLSRSVLILVLAGAVVATILAYLAINEWLASFAYRTGINPWSFVLATLGAFLVAYLTVAAQSYRTAQSDPSKFLRAE